MSVLWLKMKALAEVTRRIFIVVIGIVDLVRRAIFGTWRIGLMFFITFLFVEYLHHLADERTFDIIGVALVACVAWPILAPVFLIVFFFEHYRSGRRALRVYHHCKTVAKIIRLNQALWKRIWDDEYFLTAWEK